MSRFRNRFLLTLAAWVLFAAESAVGRPAYMKEVKCGDTVLGVMEIDTYQVGEAAGPVRGFVTIDGQFVPGAGAAGHTFHYLQAVIKDDRPPPFRDGTAITTTYIDTPPGGYQGQPFDRRPYYDQGEFPTFFDEPTINLAFTKDQADMQRELEFETWLVCVIRETLGADPNKASDDTYTVAPLLGWKWGFDQTYADARPLMVDGLEDITQTIVPFAFLAAPSAGWTNALGKVYGAGRTQDRFNVTLGDCTACVPEPSSLITLGIGTLGLIGYGWRCRKRAETPAAA
ncbi:MAG: PEP-CTERM sorting domain-containing protein [Gemmataceae bacterium]